MNSVTGEPPRIGVGLTQSATGDGGDHLAAYVRRAEEFGFNRLWALESVITGATAHMPLLDGLHCLTYAAANSTVIGLGMAVIVLPTRNPALLAKELATIDQLSGGRLLVGVALGGRQGETAARLGFQTDRRTRRLSEGVELMRALWSGADSFQGEIYANSTVSVQPRPLQQPYPPIWFGGGSNPALARAARIGDGWIASGSSSIEDFSKQAKQLDDELSRNDRAGEPFTKCKRVYIAVEENERLARTRLTHTLDGMYRKPGLTDRVGICGSAESCAEQLRVLIESGAQELILNPLYGGLEQLSALADVRGLLRS